MLLWFGFLGHAQTPVDPIPAGPTWVTDGWRYHPGDNPAWADPSLNDSDWQRLTPQQETDSCSRGCWYRLHIELPQHRTTPLALLLLAQQGVFEAYIDNHRAGSAHFEPWWLVRESTESILPLPDSGSALLALRVRPPRVAFDATEAAFVRVAVGGEQSIHDAAEAHHNLRVIRFLPSGAINLTIFLSGLAFLAVFAVQRRISEYLWLGIYLMILGSSGGSTRPRPMRLFRAMQTRFTPVPQFISIFWPKRNSLWPSSGADRTDCGGLTKPSCSVALFSPFSAARGLFRIPFISLSNRPRLFPRL